MALVLHAQILLYMLVIVTNIMFLDIFHHPVFIKNTVLFFKTQCFGDWILSLSSGKTYSVGPNR
jgi:hypothetical protein